MKIQSLQTKVIAITVAVLLTLTMLAACSPGGGSGIACGAHYTVDKVLYNRYLGKDARSLTMPEFYLSDDFTLVKRDISDDRWYAIGTLRECELSEDTLEELMTAQNGWAGGLYSIGDISKAYSYLVMGDNCWILMETSAGDVLLGYGLSAWGEDVENPAQIGALTELYLLTLDTEKMGNPLADAESGIITDNNVYTRFEFASAMEPVSPVLSISQTDNSFRFVYSYLSSYIAFGTYEIVDDTLVARTSDGLYTYTFAIDNGTYVFDSARSSALPEYRISADGMETYCPVPNGAVFINENAVN